MADTKQMNLPITGMTCANCVATVERNLKKLDGVQSAVVNLSSERATVAFDPFKLGLTDLIARVERAGYGVASGEADLMIKRLADDNDARRLERGGRTSPLVRGHPGRGDGAAARPGRRERTRDRGDGGLRAPAPGVSGRSTG